MTLTETLLKFSKMTSLMVKTKDKKTFEELISVLQQDKEANYFTSELNNEYKIVIY